jgi:hypothetical protein
MVAEALMRHVISRVDSARVDLIAAARIEPAAALNEQG